MPSATETAAGDREDMARLMRGEDRALDALMDRHAGPIFRFLHRMTGDEEEARDLAQETFARVYERRGSFDPSRLFSTWAYTIAGNLARDFLRRRGRRPTFSLNAPAPGGGHGMEDIFPDPGPQPAETMEMAERESTVRRAVAELPEDLRAAVVLCELEDKPVLEAAAILMTTPKAVESRLYRARKALRSRLKPWL